MLMDPYGWTMDFTGPQMMLTVKLSAVAFSYHDGAVPEDTLIAELRPLRLASCPSLVELAGFVYFFPAFLAGPVFSMRDYKAFADGSLFGGRARAPLVPALTRLGQACLCIGISMWAGSLWPQSVYFSSEFLSWSLARRVGYVYLAQAAFRFRYYFGFLLGEGAAVASGLGFNGVDAATGREKWDRVASVRIWQIETSQTFKATVENWNIGVAAWLKLYVYLRLAPASGPVPFSVVLVTNLMGAFWHGFYPGYYIAFMLGSVCTETARLIRRKVRPAVVELGGAVKLGYDLAGWVLCVVVMAFGSVPFTILQLDRAMHVWGSVHYLVPAGMVLALAVVRLMPSLHGRRLEGKGD